MQYSSPNYISPSPKALVFIFSRSSLEFPIQSKRIYSIASSVCNSRLCDLRMDYLIEDA